MENIVKTEQELIEEWLEIEEEIYEPILDEE